MKDGFNGPKRLFPLAWQPPQTLGSRVVVTCHLQTQSALQITLLSIPSKMRPHVVLNVHQRRVGDAVMPHWNRFQVKKTAPYGTS